MGSTLVGADVHAESLPHLEYTYYCEIEKRLVNHIEKGFSNIDSWLLTLSGGSLVVSIPLLGVVTTDEPAKHVVAIVLAWSAFFVAILFAMAAKIYAYLLANRMYAKIHNEAKSGFDNLSSRIDGRLRGRTHEKVVLTLNAICLVSFFVGLALMLTFGSLNLLYLEEVAAQ